MSLNRQPIASSGLNSSTDEIHLSKTSKRYDKNGKNVGEFAIDSNDSIKNGSAILNSSYQGEGGDIQDMQALYRLAASLGLSHSDSVSNNDSYFGVYVPHESRLQSDEGLVYVYTDKTEALKSMKQWKKSRFKQFKSWKDAEAFAENGIETTSTSCDVGMEKPVPFKVPKAQDMIRFRKAIECGDIAAVRSSIDENPRYLFSNGDTPSILQEGCRYNALHVAARVNQAAIVELVLTCVQSLPLLGRIFEDCGEEVQRARSRVLLDLYLNTPDKSCNETPLHFAVKYGSVDVVELLTSYPQCQRHLLNKYGASVHDLVCTRIADEGGHIKKTIINLLEDRYFLPVLRYEDNSMPPRVGTPFSPIKPLELQEDPLSPRLEIQALAGPMTKIQADNFRKKWRTPPMGMRASSLRLADPEKGLERVGRDLATNLKVPWREYWSFLDTFVDLSSSDGLNLLEKFLEKRFEETSYESHNSDSEELEGGAEMADNILSPVSDLCRVFRTFSIADGPRFPESERQHKYKRRVVPKNKNRSGKVDDTPDDIPDSSHQFSPIIYVERSCQVFGRRIALALSHICSDVNKFDSDNLRDCLDPEAKFFQSLVTSYLEDARFNAIDFRLAHARIAATAARDIRQQVTPTELNLLISCLREIGLTDGTVSDEEDLIYSTRESQIKTLGAIIKSHVLCLSQCLMTALSTDPTPSASILNEKHCEDIWSRTLQCGCAWDVKSHMRARFTWRRRHKITPKLLTFKSESTSVDESWRSCEEPLCNVEEAEDEFKTPPSSPAKDSEEEVLYDAVSQPDTFIYPGDRPSKTDLAVVDAISSASISGEKYPAIIRWRHLVKLHEHLVAPYGQSAPSPGAWHRRRIIPYSPSPPLPESPSRSSWERITGPFTPRRSVRSRFINSSPAR